MKRPVIAIGLDSADPRLVEKWMAEGALPNLKRLRDQGAWAELESWAESGGRRREAFSTEPLWVEFATGCKPDRTGFWDTVEYFPDRYAIRNMEHGAPVFDRCPPFYALGAGTRVAVMDLPAARLVEGVDGVQVLGWGGHFPHSGSVSMPSGLLEQIEQRYGANPILGEDKGIWWNRRYLEWLDGALSRSVSARGRLYADMVREKRWDLFLAIFSETHSAGHEIYCFSESDHPLHEPLAAGHPAASLLRRTYIETDREIGALLEAAPAEAGVVCFSLHGMGPNYSDVLSGLVLPELLYRLSFPGKTAIAGGPAGRRPPPMITSPRRGGWTSEIWARHVAADPLTRFVRSWTPARFLRGRFNGLASPFAGESREPLHWHPCMWYRPLWPKMKAFALPGFTKGHVRINLRGRERDGIVDLADYGRTCDEIETALMGLRDARTGAALVKDVARVRSDPLDTDPLQPAFDLDVTWHPQMTDVVDSPVYGRIGPVPHFRAGGHWNRGFVIASGPGTEPGSCLPTAEAADLAPTILEMMGVKAGTHFDGHSLLPATQRVETLV